MTKTDKFLQAIANLPESELELDSFWHCVAEQAQQLKTRDPLRDKICQAVAELRMNQDRPRPLAIGFRSLSGDQLRKAVLKHRECLIRFIEDCHSWKAVIASSILSTRRDQLISVLNVLGCSHNGKGSRRGDPPELTPDEATQRIMTLSSRISFYDLAVVIAGLMTNHEGWSYLESTLNRLQEEAKHARENSDQSIFQGQEPEPMKVLHIVSNPIRRIQELRGLMDALIEMLESAVAILRAGQLPDVDTITSTMDFFKIEFTAIVNELQPEYQSLEGFKIALRSREELKNILAFIDHLERLSHRKNSEFKGIIYIRCYCVETRQKLTESAFNQEKKAEVMQPLYALERLVSERENLDDIELEALDAKVRDHFGPSVAIAATAGMLEFGKPSVKLDELNKVHTSVTLDALKLPTTDPIVARPITDEDPTIELTTAIIKNCEKPELPVVSEKNDVDIWLQETPIESIEIINVVTDDMPEQLPKEDKPVYQEPVSQDLTSALTETKEINIQNITFPNASPRELDQALSSFDAFKQAFWLDPSGHIVEAPWCDHDSFATRITDALSHAIDQYEFGQAFLFLQVLNQIGHLNGWVLDDWMCAEAISESPTLIGAGASDYRAQRLQVAVQRGSCVDEDDLRLALFLEALRPNTGLIVNLRDMQRLMETTPFHDQNLTQVVTYLFWANAVGIDPIAVLSAQVANSHGLSQEQLEKDFNRQCSQLRIKIAETWMAAGGRIQRTHCRNAWKRFMEQVIQPLRDQILAADGSERLVANIQELRTPLRRLMKTYLQIMDDAEVRMQDRKVADRSAIELESAFKDILDSAERLHTFTGSTIPKERPIPITAIRCLLDSSTPLQSIEELCRQIFQCLVGRWRGRRPLRIDARLLRDNSAILGVIDPQALSEPRFVCDGLSISVFRSSQIAVATLLDKPIYYENPVALDEDLRSQIRERALEVQAHRPDLLSCLSAIPRFLESQDRNRLHRFASDLGDEVFQAGQSLRALARQCQELLDPIQATLQPVVEVAQRSADEGIKSAGLTEGLLLKGWLDCLVQVATRAKDSAINSHRQIIIAKYPTFLAAFESAVAHEDLRGIPLLSGQESGYTLALTEELRRTPWRTLERVRDMAHHWINDVEQHYQNSGEELRELVSMWINPPGNPNSRQKFRRLFYRLISGEEGIGQARRKRIFPDGLVRGGFDGNAVHIQCRIIRKMFRQDQRNPTFLPQLADYNEIVLLSPPASNLRGGRIATDWSRSVGAERGNPLVVFLAPKLDKNKRKEILSEFRARNLSAALIDDFDFWRLAMVDDSLGHDFVPFLEIVLEQLKLERISPFSSQDGQHIRLETYVGRRDEAWRLAKTAGYTRVFSGRKLGKSALLKQVEIVYDKSELPSGNSLNVLFVTIAGGDSEAWIVNQIVTAMSQRFELTEPSGSQDLLSSERFSQFVANFIEQNPQDSLLIILDEADQFVEGQLADYDRDREKSLSFQMMKAVPTRVDSHGLPRVRVILSGYRETNTRDGVWANAGEVLRLLPLQEMEAINFIQGALVRIGVDITEHASFVARRCGFQPAILIRFGQSLLNRLQNRRSAQHLGEYIAVTHNDVADTFNDESINQEIRTVVSNNFQGNRVRGVIFDALLLTMQELSPGSSLHNAPCRTLDKLREIEPNLGWLTRIDPMPEAEIKRNLRDFIDRQLLIEEPGDINGESYRLRFPHYLPVLTQQTELPLTIKQRIDALMQISPVRRRGGSILTESSLATIRYWYDQTDTDLCRLVLVGGGWLKALEDSKVGIADRLGYNTDTVCANKKNIIITGDIRVYSRLNVEECIGLAQLTARPAIVLSGIDTLRWALRQQLEGSEFQIETVPIKRITEAHISWWFEVVRALHFESPDAIARIVAITSGIPFLLEQFDALLIHINGSDITAAELRSVLDEFSKKFAIFAEELRSGAPYVRLTTREIELLTLLVLITEQGLATRLGAEFRENWALCSNDNTVTPPYEDSDDDLALRVLVGSGLIAVDEQHQQVYIQANGAESRLVKIWGGHAVD